MGWRSIALAISIAACGAGAGVGPDAGPDGGDDGVDAPPAVCLAAATYPLTIQAGAFPPDPNHPSVIVHNPDRFDPTAPIDIVVFIHGFNNCISDVIGDTNESCTPTGPLRNAYHLASQLDAADRNALLLVPEVAFDQASANPGTLGNADGFKALLDETLANVPAPLGPIDPARVGSVIVSDHSGGYRAAAGIATIGGVSVSELWLFDSLYGSTVSFDQYVMSDLMSFSTLARRFANVYTSGGGTLSNSQAMADRVAMWVAPSVIVDDRTTSTWPDATYRHGLLFKLSALAHDDVPRYYFEHMLATSNLAPRRCQ